MVAVVASSPKGVRIGELGQPIVYQILLRSSAYILGVNVREYRCWRRPNERYSAFL